MARLRALWDYVRDSLWFLPSLITLGCGALAVVLVVTGDHVIAAVDPTTAWWLFGGSAEAAQGMMSAIAGSIITVTGVTFSVTIVALQLASSQFTPRVLRQFTADRANQLVLGVFIGTFTYTLLVQRTIRSDDGGGGFVPSLAVTGAVVLALVSIGFLIFFVNHAARTIQASVIIDAIATDTLGVLDRVFPDRLPDGRDGTPLNADDYSEGRPDEPYEVVAHSAGYIQAVDVDALTKVARTGQVLIRLEVEIGTYVLRGHVIAQVWPGDGLSERVIDQVQDALIVGMERTPHQDLKFGIIELMDIAVKAMSPSVNDPTTALNALDRLGEILLECAWRQRGDQVELHRDGRPLLLLRRPRLEHMVALAYDQLRHYGAENPAIAIAMLAQAGELAALAPDSAKAAFRDQLTIIRQAAMARIENPHDQQRVEVAASRALSRAASLSATPSGIRAATP